MSRGRPLRILNLFDAIYPDSIGGIERRNYELATLLGGRGHEVTLAGWAERESFPADGVRVLPVGRSRPLYERSGKRGLPATALFAREILRLDVKPYDLVETASVPYLHIPALALKCRALGKPLLVSWYEYWGAYWRSYVGGARAPLFAAIEGAVAQLGAATTACSRLTSGRLVSVRVGSAPRLLPCGVFARRISAIADAWAGDPGPPILYAGRLVREKRLDLALRAVALLGPRLSTGGALLRVIGDGPDRTRLEDLTRELGISNRIVFDGRLKTSQDVWTRYPSARIALQPSEREGFGLFPLEAMAAGIPVVHCESSQSALSELVRPGREGERTAAEPRALAAVLERLLADVETRRTLGENARARALGYDWEVVADAVEDLYWELVPK